MEFETTLSANDYRLVRILRALANENRFIILHNLQRGPLYATELNIALKISRPALGKHVRILIKEGLAEQKHVVEGGTAKTVYELTDFGSKISERVNGLTEGIGDLKSQITSELREKLTEVNIQIKSIDEILKGIETRFKNKEITSKDYSSLKSDYEKTLTSLKKRQKALRERVKEK